MVLGVRSEYELVRSFVRNYPSIGCSFGAVKDKNNEKSTPRGIFRKNPLGHTLEQVVKDLELRAATDSFEGRKLHALPENGRA